MLSAQCLKDYPVRRPELGRKQQVIWQSTLSHEDFFKQSPFINGILWLHTNNKRAVWSSSLTLDSWLLDDFTPAFSRWILYPGTVLISCVATNFVSRETTRKLLSPVQKKTYYLFYEFWFAIYLRVVFFFYELTEPSGLSSSFLACGKLSYTRAFGYGSHKLNQGQVTRTTVQLAPPSPNYHTIRRTFELSTDLTCIAPLHGRSLLAVIPKCIFGPPVDHDRRSAYPGPTVYPKSSENTFFSVVPPMRMEKLKSAQ
ncbi:hypothetical protein TNCV_855941 [Trichonephila clavipes]|nr:hypothetical protein TNCV_855941 [Trichonephila clavipes]